jgi:hypothetical protein
LAGEDPTEPRGLFLRYATFITTPEACCFIVDAITDAMQLTMPSGKRGKPNVKVCCARCDVM